MSTETRRRVFWPMLALAAMCIGLIAYVGWSLWEKEMEKAAETAKASIAQEQAEISEENAKVIAGKVIAVFCEGSEKNQNQKLLLCSEAKDVAEKPSEPLDTNAGDLTSLDIFQAVRDYCATVSCKGEDGRSLRPTQAQALAAFTIYCSTNDGCRGPSGENGEDAPPVDPGTLGGAVAEYCGTGACDGPPPTAAQVQVAFNAFCADGRCDGRGPTTEEMDQAVAAYCANDACKGDTGDTGAKGRGVVDTQCVPDTGRWVVTYDQEPLTMDGGPCLSQQPPVTEDPAPEPGPEPPVQGVTP